MKEAIGNIAFVLIGLALVYGGITYYYSDERKARAAVRELMRDPDGVDFRNLKSVGYGPTLVVCGEFNAKNGFGAYHGFESFMHVGILTRVAKKSGDSPAIAGCCAHLMTMKTFDAVETTRDIPECAGVEPAMPL